MPIHNFKIDFVNIVTKFLDIIYIIILTTYTLFLTYPKKKFTVEMLFNIHETDFDNKIINNNINNYLLVYDYCYALLSKIPH